MEALRDVPASHAPSAQRGAEPEREASDTSEEAPRVVCAACAGFITSASEKRRIEGRELHHFVNPDGLRFELVCFRTAPGGVGVGQSSGVWTWFPGYSWQAVVCRGCSSHLGWAYRREAEEFFGLITERIVELRARQSD